MLNRSRGPILCSVNSGPRDFVSCKRICSRISQTRPSTKPSANSDATVTITKSIHIFIPLMSEGFHQLAEQKVTEGLPGNAARDPLLRVVHEHAVPA